MPVLACVDWTNDWEHAFIYTSEKQAKRDRDYLGLSLAKVVEYGVYPPPIPKETKPVEKWHVYFITERHEDKSKKSHVKVGYSKDPVKRLKQLQTGHPTKLGLDGWVTVESEEEARTMEHQIHKFFVHLQKSGEWFEYAGSMSAYVDLLRHEDKRFVNYYC